MKIHFSMIFNEAASLLTQEEKMHLFQWTLMRQEIKMNLFRDTNHRPQGLVVSQLLESDQFFLCLLSGASRKVLAKTWKNDSHGDSCLNEAAEIWRFSQTAELLRITAERQKHYCCMASVVNITIIVVWNGIRDPSSNPWWGCLSFT